MVIPPIRKSATSAGVRCRGPLAGPLRRGDTDLALIEDVVADPVPDAGLLQRLGQQPLDLKHLDATLAHHLAERVVFRFGLADPQDVIEQQFLGVRRGQTGVLQARPVHHDLAQLAHLRVHSERHVHHLTAGLSPIAPMRYFGGGLGGTRGVWPG